MSREILNTDNPEVQQLMGLDKETLVQGLLKAREQALKERAEGSWLDQLADSLRDGEGEAPDAYNEYQETLKNIKARYNNYFRGL